MRNLANDFQGRYSCAERKSGLGLRYYVCDKIRYGLPILFRKSERRIGQFRTGLALVCDPGKTRVQHLGSLQRLADTVTPTEFEVPDHLACLPLTRRRSDTHQTALLAPLLRRPNEIAGVALRARIAFRASPTKPPPSASARLIGLNPRHLARNQTRVPDKKSLRHLLLIYPFEIIHRKTAAW